MANWVEVARVGRKLERERVTRTIERRFQREAGKATPEDTEYASVLYEKYLKYLQSSATQNPQGPPNCGELLFILDVLSTMALQNKELSLQSQSDPPI
jgi:hypothetical protein